MVSMEMRGLKHVLLRQSTERLKLPLIIIAFVLFISALVQLWQPISAQPAEQVSISVSPQSLDLSINPGESVTNVFRITNGSDQSITLATTPKNFLPRGNEGAIELIEDDTAFSLAEWISVSPEEAVTVGAKRTVDFEVTISAPTNAQPGGHFGSVVFRTVPDEREGSAALISQEIAPVILVKIPGDADESGEITSFEATRQLWSNQDSISFEAIVANTGNVHYQPRGQITIKNMFGAEVAQIQVEGRNVIPGAERIFDAQWQDYGNRLGKYSADLTLVYGVDNSILADSTSFYVIPYQRIIPIVIAIAILGFIIFKSRKRIALAFKVLAGKSTEE